MFPGVPVVAHAKTGRVLNKANVVKGHFQQDEKLSILLNNWVLSGYTTYSPK
jgi:hypothetical protein